MRSFWEDILWYVIGFISSTVVMAFALQDNIKTHNACQEELSTCQEILNDPHACVSIVVEMMEGNYEKRSIKQ